MEKEGTRDPSIADLGAHVKQDLSQLREAAERRREEALAEARRFVDEHPLAAMGAAFGAGYLLSGALFSRLSARLLYMGARWYLKSMVRDVMGPLSAGVAAGMVGMPRRPEAGATARPETNPTRGGRA